MNFEDSRRVVTQGLIPLPKLPGWDEWEKEQTEALATRGASLKPEEDEAYLQHMMKCCLRGYICHREVDEYTQCLLEKKLLDKNKPLSEIAVNMTAAKQGCPEAMEKYLTCMGSSEHQDLIAVTASEQKKCVGKRDSLFLCLEKYFEPEDQEKYCKKQYSTLLRCGLNTMWDEYWKQISGFGLEEEVHLFEDAQRHKRERSLEEMKKELTKKFGFDSWGETGP